MFSIIYVYSWRPIFKYTCNNPTDACIRNILMNKLKTIVTLWNTTTHVLLCLKPLVIFNIIQINEHIESWHLHLVALNLETNHINKTPKQNEKMRVTELDSVLCRRFYSCQQKWKMYQANISSHLGKVSQDLCFSGSK